MEYETQIQVNRIEQKIDLILRKISPELFKEEEKEE